MILNEEFLTLSDYETIDILYDLYRILRKAQEGYYQITFEDSKLGEKEKKAINQILTKIDLKNHLGDIKYINKIINEVSLYEDTILYPNLGVNSESGDIEYEMLMGENKKTELHKIQIEKKEEKKRKNFAIREKKSTNLNQLNYTNTKEKGDSINDPSYALEDVEKVNVIDKLSIKLHEIVLIKGLGNYSTFYLKDKRQVISAKTLRVFEDTLLSNNNFIRVNSSHIINLNFVEDLYINPRGGEVLIGDTKIFISRRQAAKFRQSYRRFLLNPTVLEVNDKSDKENKLSDFLSSNNFYITGKEIYLKNIKL